MTTGRKEILKVIDEADSPTTTDLKQNDAILEHYEPSSVGETLRKLEEEEDLVHSEPGNPKQYELTEDGLQFVQKMRKRQQRRKEKAENQVQNGISYNDATAAFEDYFRGDEIKQEIAEVVARGGDCYTIDFKRLSKFTPEIADRFIRQPQGTMEAARDALTNLSIVDKELHVTFENLPAHRERTIRGLSIDDIDKVVTVPGVVLKASRMKPTVVQATFQCVNCRNQYTRGFSPNEKMKRPYKCSQCENDRFTTVNRRKEAVRIMKLQEKPDSPDKKTIKVQVVGSMASDDLITEMKPGTAVRLTGIVDMEKRKKNASLYETYLSAIDIDREEEKWGDIELTEEDREKNQEIVEYSAVEAFVDSVAADRIQHRSLMKEAFMLYLLGKTSNDGNLNVLVMGDPGSGKSELNKWAEEHIPKVIKAVATSASGVGLTATVKEDPDFGGYVAEGGSLTMADGGYHITDEFDKMEPEDVVKLNEALGSGTITLNKGDVIDLQLDADVSEWATANPRDYDYFDPHTPKYKQIPLPKTAEATEDRFDLIIGVEEYAADSQEKEDVIRHILRRGDDDYDGVEPEFSPEELVKFVTEANSLQPTMSTEASSIIFDSYMELKRSEGDEENMISNRGAEALKKLAVAYARANLSEVVEAKHARQALDFFRRSLESIDFYIGEDDMSDIGTLDQSRRKKVKETLEDLEENLEDGEVSFEGLKNSIEMEEEEIEEVLSNLDSDGEVFEPRNGVWKTL